MYDLLNAPKEVANCMKCNGKHCLISVVVVILLINIHSTYGQDRALPFLARNAIYLELGGINFPYSINYDRIVRSLGKRPWVCGYRVGGSLAGRNLAKSRLVAEFYTLLGHNKSHLELGIGSSLGQNMNSTVPYGSSANLFLSPTIAYRFQEIEGPSCFRVSLNPFIAINNENGQSTGLFVGISFGRSF